MCVCRIVRNGGRRRVYESYRTGHTMSMDARWPVTQRIWAWVAEERQAAAEAVLVGAVD